MLRFEADGLWAGHVNVWGDWAAHISYTTALATQPFFPPQFPILAGSVLSYPFGMDFISALLLKLGLGLVPAMLIPSFLLSVFLVAVLFFFYKLLLQNAKAATLAVFLFLLNGGLGFLWFLQDLQVRGLTILSQLPREYTALRQEANIQWINIIISELIPQRGFLLGLPITVLILSVLWRFYNGKARSREMLSAGVATGLLPIIHMHSFFVVLAMAFWTMFLSFKKEARGWLLYFLPVALLAISLISIFYPQFGTGFIRFQPGWLAGIAGDNILFFWIKNAGVMLLLPLAGISLANRKLFLWSVPFWALFALGNLFAFQPYVWDNTKFFTYWWLVTSGFAALFLVNLFASRLGGALAFILFFLAVSSGTLDVIRVTQQNHLRLRMLTNEDLEFARWAKKETGKDAVFLTADNHDNPVAMLSGRRIVLGFRGWLWTYGIDTTARAQAVEDIYRGKDAKELLNKYSVDYVVVSPQERRRYELKEDFFERNFPVVFETENTKVFVVTKK